MKTNNKNLFIAVAFIFGFLYLWDALVMSRYAPSRQKSPTATAPISSKPAVLTTDKPTIYETKPGTSAGPQDVLIKNDQNEIIINTLGARVVEWKTYERDHWIELYRSKGAKPEGALVDFADLNFAVVSNQNGQVVFEAHHPSGFVVQKTLSLLAEPPFHSLTYSFINPTKQPVQVDTALSWTGGLTHHSLDTTHSELDAIKSEMRVIGFGERVMSFKPGFIFGRTVDTTISTPLTWVGVDNLYFAALLLAPQNPITKAHLQTSHDLLPQFQVPLSMTLQPNEKQTRRFLLYVGPKMYTDLKKLNYNVAAAVDFGIFGPIAKGLLSALHFFYHKVHNYGWAIVILTICVQILVFPLTRKSLKHSARMKELQPQIKVLQEQFKSDPKRLQIETFNLYKKNGMKLMGMEGCFPMLLQMPIFFAFYSTIRAAYELRGAPWIFWIHDLGVKDPYYLLPILMGGGMFLQQKLTAVAADPAQARMMMFMPIIFTFMFLQLPSGLVLYWLVNSIMSILIQSLLMWNMKRNASLALTSTT